jgi:hypothetical protein
MVVVAEVLHLLLEVVVQAAQGMVQGLKIQQAALLLQILVAVVGEQERTALQPYLAALAVQVSSSSRPINNEDKWKPKSIGCMESTPQCTC